MEGPSCIGARCSPAKRVAVKAVWGFESPALRKTVAILCLPLYHGGMETRRCKKCKKIKPLVQFSHANQKYKTRRHVCNACRDYRDYESTKNRISRQRKERRQIHPVPFIYADTRKYDKRNGLQNDLTHEFIAEQIAKPCVYCGETDLKITLDRIDNTAGHTQDNVLPACIRCNYTRKNMPYAAWLVVASAMKEARELGLFQDWTGQARRSK